MSRFFFFRMTNQNAEQKSQDLINCYLCLHKHFHYISITMTQIFKFKLIAMMMTSLPFLSAAQDKEIPDFSSKDRKEVPLEYTWKIEDIYSSLDGWKKDKDAYDALIEKIDATAKGWTTSPQKMLALFDLQIELSKKGTLLYSYISHQKNTDMGNAALQSMMGEIQSKFVKVGTKFSFMSPDILALGSAKVAEYLKAEPKLQVYKFKLDNILRKEQHILPDEQQKIVSLTGLFGESFDDASMMLNNLEIPPAEITLKNGEKVVLNTSNYVKLRSVKEREDRKLVVKAFMENQKKFEKTHAILLNSEIKKHLFNSQVYKYPDCLSAKLHDNDISPDVYNNLIKLTKENLAPLHRFLNLKKKLLKLDKLHTYDLFASAVPSIEKKFLYDDAKKIITESLLILGKDYTEGLNKAFSQRWIDIYPNRGKESGAYSGGVYGVHPYIKMNYNGKYDALSTLTHELGHAMHTYFSDKNQNFINTRYPTFLAEIASTFNENMLVQYMLKNEKDDLFKLYLLDNYLEQIRATLYHQTFFAEFELAMHKKVEEGQTLTAEWLNENYLNTMKTYYGHDKQVCEVSDYSQCGWSLIPHFYYNFYVFQYSTGIIASLALCDRVLNGGQLREFVGAEQVFFTNLISLSTRHLATIHNYKSTGQDFLKKAWLLSYIHICRYSEFHLHSYK